MVLRKNVFLKDYMAITNQNKMKATDRVEQMVSRLKEGDHRITPPAFSDIQSPRK
jgi:hypothetical protein